MIWWKCWRTMQQTKLFTPHTANQTLPLVRKIVADILHLGQEIRAVSAKVGQDAQDDPMVIKLMDQLEELFEEMEALGCSYKDWNFTLGLVDFPCVIDGKEVCLCWRSDEEELKYYHEMDSGYAGRKLIPKEPLLSNKQGHSA